MGIQNRVFRLTASGLEPHLAPLPEVHVMFGLGSTDNNDLWATTDRGVLRFQGTKWEAVPGDQPRANEVRLHHLVAAGPHTCGSLPTSMNPAPPGTGGTARGCTGSTPPVWRAAVFATAGLPDGQLVVAPHGGGLAVYQGATSVEVDLPVVYDECVKSLVEIAEPGGTRYLVALTDSERLFTCHLSSDRWLCRLPSRAGLHNNVNALAPSQKGGLWVGCQSGVARFDGRDFQDVHREALGQPLYGVTAVFEDELGHLWVGAGNDITGVYRFDGERWHHHQEPEGVGRGHVHAIRAGPGGSIWFLLLGTEHDVVWTEGEPLNTVVVRRDRDGTWTAWSMDHGLPGNRAYDLVTDRAGRTFVATSRGVAVAGRNPLAYTHRTRRPALERTRVLSLRGPRWFPVDRAGLVPPRHHALPGRSIRAARGGTRLGRCGGRGHPRGPPRPDLVCFPARTLPF